MNISLFSVFEILLLFGLEFEYSTVELDCSLFGVILSKSRIK